jgi:predicted small secreted protein
MTRLLSLLLICSGLSLAGCNTIAGAGKDIESGGEAVQDTARDVQKKM